MKRKGKQVSDSQARIYDILKQHGPMPDHALVPLVQHAHHVRISSSGIRTRRHELETLGLVETAGATETGSGRFANVFKAVK